MAKEIPLHPYNSINDQTFLKYKKLYWGWAVKNWSTAGDDAIEEVFFDALSIYLEYERKGKITEGLKPTTFIISVAHRMFQKRHKSAALELTVDLPETIETNDNRGQKELMRKALLQLGDRCREILIAKYFHNYSMDEIMEETGAASRAVVRTQKKRCMQQLKAKVHQMMAA